jgi:hypothetical protein
MIIGSHPQGAVHLDKCKTYLCLPNTTHTMYHKNSPSALYNITREELDHFLEICLLADEVRTGKWLHLVRNFGGRWGAA